MPLSRAESGSVLVCSVCEELEAVPRLFLHFHRDSQLCPATGWGPVVAAGRSLCLPLCCCPCLLSPLIALWIALALTLFLLFVWVVYMRLESLVLAVAWVNKFMSCTQSLCSHRPCLGGLALWGGDQILETEMSRAAGAKGI